jgi:hypothetical protein
MTAPDHIANMSDSSCTAGAVHTWHLSVSFDKRSGRKPAGFDKASAARELECNVNAHLAPQRAA